ncbi:hypothetical protein B0H16DRAFT_1827966 [Mycena metata]|uniref:Fungal-type protein kinase domain-containing protein n=1 Tax=Mycena metata TaxID=1033252 RepID=A0AAD7J376_9AGAR|nr:hypothetical protein B0H16DRAFT_1827966 [Mycena metata]
MSAIEHSVFPRSVPLKLAARPSTPPRQTLSAPLQDTPTHLRLSSVQPYSSLQGVYQQRAHVAAAGELHHKYTFTDPETFLSRHLPQVDPTESLHHHAPALHCISLYTPERKMYAPLVAELNQVVKPGWSVVDTSDHADPDSGFILDQTVKPDLSIYDDRPPSNTNLCRACDMECFLELKTEPADDPFADQAPRERTALSAEYTRGQVITYLNAIQASQFRTHSFGVVIVKDKCRLLRLTKSGIEVTSAFNYTNTHYLHQFLYRLSRAEPETRGIDTTFESMAPATAPKAAEILGAPNGPLWQICVGDRTFLVSRPFTRSHELPVGRGTRCFVAVDKRTNQKCLLKDTWRVDGYHAEHEVYERLKAQDVKGIPGVLAAADVPGQACGSHPESWSTPNDTTRCHYHYRIALDVVGIDLTKYPSSRHLVRYVLEALEAHFRAYTCARVEHRDISVGNIIIVRTEETSHALLIDWELARYHDDEGPSAYERTGTRQFMSCALSQTTPPPRLLVDDLESFVLLLMWMAVLYAPSYMSPTERASYAKDFDGDHTTKKLLLASGDFVVNQFQLVAKPLSKLLITLSERIRIRYLHSADQEQQEQQAALNDHAWLIDILRNSLDSEGWPTDDAGARQEVDHSSQKRKSVLSHYEERGMKRSKQDGERGPDEEECGPDEEERGPDEEELQHDDVGFALASES